MSFIRSCLAELRIAYVPKIGHNYRYAIEAPFAYKTTLTPKILRDGYVLYDMQFSNGMVQESSCPAHVFASMCKEVK